MKVKNLTDFPFGAKVCSRKPPRPEMTVIVRAAFSFEPGETPVPLEDMDQGSLTADMYEEDDDERVGDCIYPGDFADFKPHADVLLRGSCHVPKGKPVPACEVGFAVGDWTKKLTVIGDRSWSKGLLTNTMSDPQPFTSMPIDYARAFGGEGHLPNPAGKGFKALELPNVEDPDRLIRKPRDKPTPAGFGPLNPAWGLRKPKVGQKYGEEWKKERAPYFSEDFDWTFFNAAPEDQQLPRYLRGDELVRLKNLIEGVPSCRIPLPGLRVRAFVKDLAGKFWEVAMNLDTLYVEPEERKLSLTWRGLDRVKTDDLTDVKILLLASEELADDPLPVEHYRQKLERFEADPMGLEDLDPETKEVMEQSKALQAGIAAGGGPASDPSLDAASAVIGQRMGGLYKEEQGKMQQAIARSLSSSEAGGLDIRGKLGEAVAKIPTKPAAPPPLGKPPQVKLKAMLGELGKMAEGLREISAKSNVEFKGLAKLDALLSDSRLKDIDPSYSAPGEAEATPDKPGPDADLSGQDLSGQDLSGLDLSRTNLEGTNLSGANLSGTKLTGARFKFTMLYEADLTKADLSDSEMEMASFEAAKAEGAVFNRAKMVQVVLGEADLTGASLDEVEATMCQLPAARLNGASARKATFQQCDFSEANLEEADFSDAKMTRCLIGECKAAGLVMRRATLDKSSFYQTDLSDACFIEAQGEGTIWEESTLNGTDFSGARLPDSHFSESRVSGALFVRADLRKTRFHKATLQDVQFVQTNMLSADMTKCQARKTTFRGSNLYDAKFVKAKLERCVFTDANLKNALMEKP